MITFLLNCNLQGLSSYARTVDKKGIGVITVMNAEKTLIGDSNVGYVGRKAITKELVKNKEPLNQYKEF